MAGKDYFFNWRLLNISVFYFPEFLKALLPADSSLQLTTQIDLSIVSSLKTKQVWTSRNALLATQGSGLYLQTHCASAKQMQWSHSQQRFARHRVKTVLFMQLKPSNESVESTPWGGFYLDLLIVRKAFILKGCVHLFHSLTFISVQATIKAYWNLYFYGYHGT